ncbi:MAG: Rieske 2Fe-2S domain-containing protein [Candidatus Omnitrophica bacterium]|nr:Rieske 2Fe-2S domain-containing protein [Candidatus Omnitrophota bacterium]
MTETPQPPVPPAATPPPAPKPAAMKPGKSMHQDEVDQNKLWSLWFTRKEFLTLAAWGAFFAGLGGSVLAGLRFFIPAVTYDPPTVFKIGKPADYAEGQVDARWKQKHRIWVVRDTPALGGGLYVIFARCTHLGCTPNWLPGQNKFKCPCHGSGFRWGGINFEGPAPRPLERCQVALADDGQVQVNVGSRFKDPKDWKRPEAYLKA